MSRRTAVDIWAKAGEILARDPESLHSRLLMPVVREAYARRTPLATLCREAGVNRATLHHFIAGRNSLGIDVIDRLHKWAGVRLVCQ